MDQHLVIGEFIALGGLDDSVERQNPSEIGVLEDHQILMPGLLAVQDFGDPETLLVVLVEPFGEPVPAHSRTPRRCTVTVSRPGRNQRLSTGIAACGSHWPHMKTSNAA